MLPKRDSHGASTKNFLKPVDALVSALKSSLPLDFVVLAMSSAILHDLVFADLMGAIFGLLRKRYCVHLRLISFPEHGIPQDRKVFVLLASPVCGPAPWANPTTTTAATVGSLIEDLAFKNPSVKRDGTTSFSCTVPAAVGWETQSGQRIIYNHQTGLHTPNSIPLDLNSSAMQNLFFSRAPFSHPSKFGLFVSLHLEVIVN